MDLFTNVSIAFLSNGKDFLLMKRSLNKKNAAGLWDGVGGRLEQDELNNPRAACLREINEETGITSNNISDFKLKYIILQRLNKRVQIFYIYFGNSSKREVSDTDEGELHWVAKDKLLQYEFTTAIGAVLTHYLECSSDTDDIFVGTLISQNNKPLISWNQLFNWEMPI